MSKRKEYFNDNEKMVDYLMKILNESYSGNNIDTDEDPQKRSSCFMCGRKKNSSTTKYNKRVRFVCKQYSKKQTLWLPFKASSAEKILG